MVDKEKAGLISSLSRDIANLNNSYIEENAYYDYDTVIDGLTKLKEVMQETLRCQRPEGLPEHIIWNEKPYEGEDLDPFVFDGSMSVEEFERWQDSMLEGWQDLMVDEEQGLD